MGAAMLNQIFADFGIPDVTECVLRETALVAPFGYFYSVTLTGRDEFEELLGELAEGRFMETKVVHGHLRLNRRPTASMFMRIICLSTLSRGDFGGVGLCLNRSIAGSDDERQYWVRLAKASLRSDCNNSAAVVMAYFSVVGGAGSGIQWDTPEISDPSQCSKNPSSS